jgi:hypothetical protein
MTIRNPDSRQITGSEYSGVDETKATIQPKGAEALNNGDILRLGYLTGEESDTESLEDRRQFLGLHPATGPRPNWLKNTGQEAYAETDLENYLGDD